MLVCRYVQIKFLKVIISETIYVGGSSDYNVSVQSTRTGDKTQLKLPLFQKGEGLESQTIILMSVSYQGQHFSHGGFTFIQRLQKYHSEFMLTFDPFNFDEFQ